LRLTECGDGVVVLEAVKEEDAADERRLRGRRAGIGKGDTAEELLLSVQSVQSGRSAQGQDATTETQRHRDSSLRVALRVEKKATKTRTHRASLPLCLGVSVAQLPCVLDYLCVDVEQTDQNEYRNMICVMRMNPAWMFVWPKFELLTLFVP